MTKIKLVGPDFLGFTQAMYNQLSRHLGTPKQKKDASRRCRMEFRQALAIRGPPLVPTSYRAHPSGRCVSCSYWIAHEVESVTTSDICRAASRYESSGNEAAHAQPAFLSPFYISPDLTRVHHKVSSSNCRIASPSEVNAWGMRNFVWRFQLHVLPKAHSEA